MSSQEDSDVPAQASGNNAQPEKKRRVRACDMCRRRKVRCDGGRTPGNQCSNCVTFKYACTYTQSAKKRFSDPEYVQNLESQLARTRELLHRLTHRLEAAESANCSQDSHTEPSSSSGSHITPTSAFTTPPDPPTEVAELDSSDDEFCAKESLEGGLRNLCLGTTQPSFLGKSSSLMFIHTALDMKDEFVGQTAQGACGALGDLDPKWRPAQRAEYWVEHPWVMKSFDQVHPVEVFPELPLMMDLVEVYFEHSNAYLPFLHRPTFENSIREGLHLRNEGFGSSLLLVCAIGARFSNDPRVFLDPSNSHSAGWKWFHHVQSVRKAIKLVAPTVYDLHVPCLAAMFVAGSSCPQASSAVIALGIRVAQDLGAHRRKVYKQTPTAEGEMLKRAFWALLLMDRNLSSALGRPCCIQDEDYDLDLPLEVDDEYWFNPDPNLAFKQPPGKPSVIAHFNCYIRLVQIHARALRTIYAINRSKALLGFADPHAEQQMVAELDSSLNKWIDSIPDHLRWDPNRENTLFFNQSAFLYSSYYTLQIVVHRPFIPSPRKGQTSSPLSFPSLAICTNAARSAVHVLEQQYNRCEPDAYKSVAGVVTINILISLFSSGIALIINIWGGKRSGTSLNLAKEMEEVHKCMKMLKALEPRWHTAGRILDVMHTLTSLGDLPLPSENGASSLKRGRDEDTTASTPSTSSTNNTPAPEHRPIAGPSRLQRPYLHQPQAVPYAPSFMAGSNMDSDGFELPVHSEELGRLPLHPAFGMSTPDHDFSSKPTWNTFPTVSHPTQPPGQLDQDSQSMFVQGGMSFDPSFMFTPPASFDSSGFAATPQDHGSMLQQQTSLQSPAGVHDTMDQHSWQALGVDGGGNTTSNSESLDDDTLALWLTAPSSIEWSDWGAYISNLSGMDTTNTSGNSPASNL